MMILFCQAWYFVRLNWPRGTKGDKGDVLFIKVVHYNDQGQKALTQREVLSALGGGERRERGGMAILNFEEHLLKISNLP